MREEMNVTVTELAAGEGLEQAWQALVSHTRRRQSDLVLLPEMPFYPWLFGERAFRPAAWGAAEAAHEAWLLRLAELAPAVVATSRPVTREGRRLNEAFVWEPGNGYRALHHKRYLPDEAGFWEASWYERGAARFEPASVILHDGTVVTVGFLVCTELWFMEHARAYGQRGVHLLLNPRATERRTRARWLAAGKVAAIIGGAYTLSANQRAGGPQPEQLGGQGWVVDPEGELLAQTGATAPFQTVSVDLSAATVAKGRYPRYVQV